VNAESNDEVVQPLLLALGAVEAAELGAEDAAGTDAGGAAVAGAAVAPVDEQPARMAATPMIDIANFRLCKTRLLLQGFVCVRRRASHGPPRRGIASTVDVLVGVCPTIEQRHHNRGDDQVMIR